MALVWCRGLCDRFYEDFPDVLAGLPQPVAQDLGTALWEASLDPYALPMLMPSTPHARVVSFADRGRALLEIDEDNKRLYVDHVVWHG